jgi:hypothetical protein
MAKIQLTLSPNYVRNWGVWEGIREILQNALDAQDDGHFMKVSHSGTTLRVLSIGATLDKGVWLMGTSSKASGGYRGHFGEGLKLGILCLVRAGHEVKMVNRTESWTPKMENSEVFEGRDVLTIYTRERATDCGGFLVEIEGVDKEAWGLIKERILPLNPAKETIQTRAATILLDESLRGKVFVKGIFVNFSKDLSAGFDFKTLETDRDRKMVDSWDLRYHAAEAWEEAMTKQEVSGEEMFKRMQTLCADVQGVGSSSYSKVREHLVAAFLAKYGEGAMPVLNMAESREAEHFGKLGVVLPESLTTVLQTSPLLNLKTTREAYAVSAQKTYGWSDLSADEASVYTSVLAIVENAAMTLGYDLIADRLNIVDFGDASLNGLYEGGTIKLAKKLLSSFEDTLRVLVHEVAHANGGDGEKGHEVAEGKLYCRIIADMRAPMQALVIVEGKMAVVEAVAAPVVEEVYAPSCDTSCERCHPEAFEEAPVETPVEVVMPKTEEQALEFLCNPDATEAQIEASLALLK